MYADLHLHTWHSDGTYSPEELVSAAVREGLSVISLTDHDTMEGCADAARGAAAAGIEFVPGTELTAELDGRELHILGYFLDASDPELAAELEAAQAIRRRRVEEMVDRLNRRGVSLSAEVVWSVARCRAPGRPHVARALVEAGWCADADEAFERYLKKDRPGWVPKKKMSAEKALRLIHGAGGLAVMAHPGLNHDDRMIGRLARMGIDGLECLHPRHAPGAVAKYEGMARELGLAVTGGSDCHGQTKGRPTIGTVRLPRERVEALRERLSGRPAAVHPISPGPSSDRGVDAAGSEAAAESKPADGFSAAR